MTRGEIFLADLDPIRGSEQAGSRPVLVFQNDGLIATLRTVVVIPFTTNARWGRFPFTVAVRASEAGLTADSIALCHQIRVLDKGRLSRRYGQVSDATVSQIEQAVALTFGM